MKRIIIAALLLTITSTVRAQDTEGLADPGHQQYMADTKKTCYIAAQSGSKGLRDLCKEATEQPPGSLTPAQTESLDAMATTFEELW